MANIKQQKKRIIVAQRQRLENLRYRSSIKTYFRRLEQELRNGDGDAAQSEHRTLVQLLDKAAAAKALHPNTAARKKSRAAKLVAEGAPVVEPKRRGRSGKAVTGGRRAAAPRTRR